MKFFLIVFFCICGISLTAQKTVDVSSSDVSALSTSFFSMAGGEPFVAKFTKLVEGTPYFKDEWLNGTVVLNEKSQYSGIYIKLDLYDNEVHFRNPQGNELVAAMPIQKLILFDTAAQRVFNFVNGVFILANSRVSGWYQLLTEGKVLLFKQNKKLMIENKPYGSATVEQSIITSFHYFVLYNKEFKEIKKLKDLPEVLSDKKEQLIQYIKTNNFVGKTDEDFEKVINYFTSLN